MRMRIYRHLKSGAVVATGFALSLPAHAEGTAESYMTTASAYLTDKGIASVLVWAGATMAIVAALWVLRKLGGR